MRGMRLLLALACAAAAGLAAKPPNFVLYLTDDLGLGEVSAQNPNYAFPANAFGRPAPGPGVVFNDPNRTIVTPSLARLAASGMRGFLSYSPSAECAPSRAGIMVGRNVGTLPIRGDSVLTSTGLNPDLVETSIASVLAREKGYDTAIIGKWGLGSSSGAPWNQGFNSFYGQLEQIEAWSYFPNNVWSYNIANGTMSTAVSQLLQPLPGNIQCTAGGAQITESDCPLNPPSPCQHTNDMFRAQALQFIAQHESANSPPFFLYWTPTAPHVGYYTATSSALLTSPVKRLGNRAGQMTRCRRGHAAQIEQHIDQDIGALLSLLETKPSLDFNTLVVFATDNGAHQDCQDDPEYTVDWFGSTAGLRGHKRTMWEGGLRSPTIFRWTGKIQPGSSTTFPHSLYDLPATFLDLAGVNSLLLPSSGPLGGPGLAVSLANVLTGRGAIPKRDFMHYEWCASNDPSQCSTATYDVSKVRGANFSSMYKLIVFPNNALELFDIVADPFETNDLSNSTALRPQISRLLVARMQSREPFCYGSSACCYHGPGCSYLSPNMTFAPTSSLSPSSSPSTAPTSNPTLLPTQLPSSSPTMSPVTHRPSISPSQRPTRPTTALPTLRPTTTKRPSTSPTLRPTSSQPSTSAPVSKRPTSSAPSSAVPSLKPTTSAPSSESPSSAKPSSASPTSSMPTFKPTLHPTSQRPSSSAKPTTGSPTSHSPTTSPGSQSPSHSPSLLPTASPQTSAPVTSSPVTMEPTSWMPTSNAPSLAPWSVLPSSSPTMSPISASPSLGPTTLEPSSSPSQSPSDVVPSSNLPSTSPTFARSRAPSFSPVSALPSKAPLTNSVQPSSFPTAAPSMQAPSYSPTSSPVSGAHIAGDGSLSPTTTTTSIITQSPSKKRKKHAPTHKSSARASPT